MTETEIADFVMFIAWFLPFLLVISPALAVVVVLWWRIVPPDEDDAKESEREE